MPISFNLNFTQYWTTSNTKVTHLLNQGLKFIFYLQEMMLKIDVFGCCVISLTSKTINNYY